VGSRSGAQIRDDLANGEPVTWQFSPGEKRLSLSLPDELGGRTYEVCLQGGYTFVLTRAGDV
jgi:hypothetical protein